uniref:Uncharacterized protein n=1 Tax=Siphoviridae sp. ctvyM23 TaxID=2826514 RepID=A0A8S5MHY6_9CAUD|nr:MAG TPA: hypothetical protein [Siphoviridae sp. ctvyM23]
MSFSTLFFSAYINKSIDKARYQVKLQTLIIDISIT